MKNELLKWCRTGDYQRDNFDNFLKAVKFSFKVPSVHIAGSNGKGSTAHFLEMSYIDAGYKVGSFTSPCLYEINELIKINNSLISDDDFLKICRNYLFDNLLFYTILIIRFSLVIPILSI